MTGDQQRAQLDLLNRLNRRHLDHSPQEAELAARIESFELAYRMQMAAPEALDVELRAGGDPAALWLRQSEVHPLRPASADGPPAGRAGRAVRADLQRRHGERAELGRPRRHRQEPRGFAGETDKPIAGLLTDLKQRGLLDSTLVIWCGEFGRLPIVQKGGTGRDHNPHAFTTWLAGGGVKGGVHYGETDEIGHKAVVDRVSINDLHATILHLLGIDHERLTYRYNGRDFPPDRRGRQRGEEDPGLTVDLVQGVWHALSLAKGVVKRHTRRRSMHGIRIRKLMKGPG